MMQPLDTIGSSPREAVLLAISALIVYLLTSAIYNIFFHPLSHIPGPVLAKISWLPSYYHALSGRRHIWLWRMFETYGSPIRYGPSGIMYNTGAAYTDIYSAKANVRKADFYRIWSDTGDDSHMSNTDPAAHARARRVTETTLSPRAVQSAVPVVARHVDRWNELLVGGSSRDAADQGAWSAARNCTDVLHQLLFDITSELWCGRSFETKEPGDNPIKAFPDTIKAFALFTNPIGHAPFLGFYIFLKRHGLDTLMQHLAPPAVVHFNKFIAAAILARSQEPAKTANPDVFHHLSTAVHPGTCTRIHSLKSLHAEAKGMIMAATDTTSNLLCGFFFYITRSPAAYARLTTEIRQTFAAADDIVPGARLNACVYLRAVLDEVSRITPGGPGELPRLVLPGGTRVCGEQIPAGTLLGVPHWPLAYNESLWGDPRTFRPERWIAGAKTGVSDEDVRRCHANNFPFTMGPTACLGKGQAQMVMALVVARTLWRFDVRKPEGSMLGQGAKGLGWGREDEGIFQVRDAYFSVKDGPEVEFRRRVT